MTKKKPTLIEHFKDIEMFESNESGYINWRIFFITLLD